MAAARGQNSCAVSTGNRTPGHAIGGHTVLDDPAPSVEIGYDGWVFPKGGVAFVWVLASEAATRLGASVVKSTKR